MARPTYIRGMDDKHDKVLFIVCVIGGLLAISMVRFLGEGLGSLGNSTIAGFVAIAIGIGIIFLYTVFIWQSRARSPMSIDRASDNAYYIGLLFTLWSLGISLYKISVTTLEKGEIVLTLLPDFGLALGSTIAGIFARVFLQQLRGNPDDVETEVREELGKSALALRTSIGSIVADLNSLSEQISVSLNELSKNVTEVMDNTAKANEETNKNISENFDRINKKSEEQMELIYRSSSRVTAQMEGLVTKIQEEFTGLGEAPQVLQRGIERVSTQMTGLSQTTEKIVYAQEELLRQTTALAGQFKYMNEAVDPAKLSQLSESTITSLIELQSKSTSINEDFKQIGNVSEELRTSEKEATEAVNTFIRSLNQATVYLTDFIRGNPKG